MCLISHFKNENLVHDSGHVPKKMQLYFSIWTVFNPAPGDPLSWKVYFQPASAHLPAIFKQSWGAWLAASGVFD